MAVLEPPDRRTCERCGREEFWSDDRGTWVVTESGPAGNPHCVHVWDITGTYNPVET